MARKHCRCPLSERQQEILLEMVHGRWCPQGLAQRGAMILESFAGKRNDHIALALGCERHTVGVWRGRWRKAYDHLIHVECFGKPGELRQAIMEVLKDQPRPAQPVRNFYRRTDCFNHCSGLRTTQSFGSSDQSLVGPGIGGRSDETKNSNFDFRPSNRAFFKRQRVKASSESILVECSG